MGKARHSQRLVAFILGGFVGLLLASVAPSDPGADKAKPAADQREPALFGVVTEFSIQPTEIKHADKLQITLKMTNVTREPVKFRYSCCIESHVRLFDSKGEHVHWKQGAPIPECPYQEIEIKPGTTVERKEAFPFGRYYSVPAGTYAMAFEYDLRLMKAPEAGKDPWVSWSKSRLKVKVKE